MDEDSSPIREPLSDLYEMTLDPSMALQLEPSSPSDASVLDPTSRDFILNIETTSNREDSESSSTEEMEVTKRLSSLNVGKLTRLVTSMKPPDSGIVSTGRTKQRRRRRRKSALKRKRKRKLACAANSESETKKLRSLASPRLSETEEKEKSSDKETVVMDDGSIKSNSSYTPKMIDSPADEPQLTLTEESIRRLGHVVRGPRIDYTDACSSGEDSVFVNPPSPQACSFKFSNVLSKIEGGEETADERGRDGDDEESCVEGEMIARAIPWWKREYPAMKSDQEEDEEFSKLLAMGKSLDVVYARNSSYSMDECLSRSKGIREMYKKKQNQRRLNTRMQLDHATSFPMPIPEANVGSRMLRSMGWDPGSGLGKRGDGVTEPVQVHKRPRRRGLGHE